MIKARFGRKTKKKLERGLKKKKKYIYNKLRRKGEWNRCKVY